MSTCDDCKEFGLSFKRKYSPEEFFASRPTCEVWIVGLNPKDEGNGEDVLSKEELEMYFSNQNIHSYFKNFKSVSKVLYGSLMDGKVAHTDIVKCLSKKWPPENISSNGVKKIFTNCTKYLVNQIETNPPKMLICNGAPVSELIKSIIIPIKDDKQTSTSYNGVCGGKMIRVILSGFIGRIDVYARRRLGREIESAARDVGITW